MFQSRISTRSSSRRTSNNTNNNNNRNQYNNDSDIYDSSGRVQQDVSPLKPQPPPPLPRYPQHPSKHPQQSQQQQQQQQQHKEQQKQQRKTLTPSKINTDWPTDIERNSFDRKYDLTPVNDNPTNNNNFNNNVMNSNTKRTTPSYTIDPYEFSPCSTPDNKKTVALSENRSPQHLQDDDDENYNSNDANQRNKTMPGNVVDEEDYYEPETIQHAASTFITPEDIHPNMENKEEEIIHLRLLAGKLSADWAAPDFMAPALARRIRDFQFAQDKRRKKYGDERPWGILGLYDHLSTIRIDVEWAEDAARRRANGDSYLSWAEFDESKKGGHNRPYFTYALLFICSAVMISSIALNEWTIESLSENAMVGPSAETLIRMGAKDSELIVNQHQGWRIVTSSFLHAGLVHFLINMLALWFVGAAIEMTHGWVAAAIIFTLSSIGGTVLSAIFLPAYITVGASGGIFGFIGACLADILMNWRLLFADVVTENGKKHRHVMILIVLFFDIALNSIIGLTPYVDNYNHLGGMIYGFLCGLSTIERLSADFFGIDNGFMSRAKQLLMRYLGLLVTFVAIVSTLVILLNGDGVSTPCPKCTWISCVPFPPWEDETNKWWYCDDCGRVTADVVVDQPVPYLDLYCPRGPIMKVDLSTDELLDRLQLKKNLAAICRSNCLAEA